MGTKQDVADRCMRKINAIGAQTITLYASGTQYTLEQALVNEMIYEMEEAFIKPVQFSEFTLDTAAENFFIVSIAELTHYRTNVKFESDSIASTKAIVLSKVMTDKMFNEKLHRIFKVIWEDALAIYEGRY